MSKPKLRWLKLDNAAKIYPAALRQNWSNVYRLSVTLTEPVDPAVLQSALDATVPRFPSIAARLRRGLFWYYLQQLEKAPDIRQEYSFPLTRMRRDEIRKCALRVIVYENRIALELFHSLTDGSGALIFLKTLLAEYLLQKYGVNAAGEGILDRSAQPDPAELEDSFPKYAGKLVTSRKENNAWHLSGTEEPDGFMHITCFELPVKEALEKAREHGVSLTVFLGALLLQALQSLQAEKISDPQKRPPLRLQIPVNLRNLFPSKTLRNFALYTTPEILPRLGHYSFEELCKVIRHTMGAEITQKHMSMRIATNVSSEQNMAVRLIPLFLKNIVMRAVFDAVGERKSCLSMSNLGRVDLPEEMARFVRRFDFILGVQAAAPNNCGILSYGDILYINFIRNTKEPDLERHFHLALQSLGLTAQVQTNS